MKKALGLSCLLVLLGVTTGRAADTKEYEGVRKEIISKINKLGDVLATVKDKGSADKAKPDIKKLVKELQALDVKHKKLGTPTKEQETELTKKHGKAFAEAFGKFTGEIKRLATEPYGKDLLTELMPKKKKAPPPKKDD